MRRSLWMLAIALGLIAAWSIGRLQAQGDSGRINSTKPMNEQTPKAIDNIPRIRELHCWCSHRSVILGICRPVHELSAHLR
jgi:hypothetical protein